MPFIAIAVAVSLFLGGGAVVATQTTAGEHAVASVSHTWAHAKSEMESRFDASARLQASSSEATPSEGEAADEGSSPSQPRQTNVDISSKLDVSI